jgi:hypothetical protein
LSHKSVDFVTAIGFYPKSDIHSRLSRLLIAELILKSLQFKIGALRATITQNSKNLGILSCP